MHAPAAPMFAAAQFAAGLLAGATGATSRCLECSHVLHFRDGVAMSAACALVRMTPDHFAIQSTESLQRSRDCLHRRGGVHL